MSICYCLLLLPSNLTLSAVLCLASRRVLNSSVEISIKMLDKEEVVVADGDQVSEEDKEPIDYENDGEFYEKAQKYWSRVDATVNGKTLFAFLSLSSGRMDNGGHILLDLSLMQLNLLSGMLGGFSEISTKELASSRSFLDEIFRCKPCPEKKLALDCGAGIGRVTKGLLMPLFEKVK